MLTGRSGIFRCIFVAFLNTVIVLKDNEGDQFFYPMDWYARKVLTLLIVRKKWNKNMKYDQILRGNKV